MFHGWKSSVLSLYNGAVDSSAVVLLFCKLVYDAGIPLRTIAIFYFTFAIGAMFLFTFILPPNTITSERIEAMLNESKSSHDTTTIHEYRPLFHSDKEDEVDEIVCIDGESNEDSPFQLIDLMTSAEYILLVWFLSLCNLRLWYYVDSLNSYLGYMSGNDLVKVSDYTNWFGIVQFLGFVFAPFVGYVIDCKSNIEGSRKTDMGFVTGFFLTSFIALLLNILVLIPVLNVQYLTFVVQVVFRAFVYTVYSAFILHKFPMSYFGTLYGIGKFIAAMVGSLQYALFAVAEDIFGRDPFWVNVIFLMLCLSLNVLPGLLWLKEKRQ